MNKHLFTGGYKNNESCKYTTCVRLSWLLSFFSRTLNLSISFHKIYSIFTIIIVITDDDDLYSGLQVKIWFQNRRSKFKKLVKQRGGEQGLGLDKTAAASLFSPSVNGTDTCTTPPSSSSSPPAQSPKSSHIDKQTPPTATLPPEVGGTEMTSSFDRFTGIQHAGDAAGFVSPQTAPSIADWTPAVGTWRTDEVEAASPYTCWPTYGLHSSTAGNGLTYHGGRIWPPRLAEEQWAPMSGFDRRYPGGGLVGAQPRYSGCNNNTRHLSYV